MATGEDAVRLLESIDSTLKAMLALAQQRTAQVRASQPKPVASDRDLDGRYGNPELKFMPRDWTGPSFKGSRLSECPADLLDLVAETFDYFAAKADEKHEITEKGKPVSEFKRADAARARGWAKRIREGVHTPAGSGSPSHAEGWDETDWPDQEGRL